MSVGETIPFKITNLDELPATPLKSPDCRTQVKAPCPGRLENTVVLLKGKECREGIVSPKNVGTCRIHVAYYDASGTWIGSWHLDPGDGTSGLVTFPSNTEIVRFGCARDCSGTAIMEYGPLCPS
jgi:hypothetical protein